MRVSHWGRVVAEERRYHSIGTGLSRPWSSSSAALVQIFDSTSYSSYTEQLSQARKGDLIS